MKILIVGNVIKDVYLNLDTRTEKLEQDKKGTNWLDISFNTSEHHFFNRHSSLSGAAISLEVFSKFSIEAKINNSDLEFTSNGPSLTQPADSYRYILIADDNVSYLTPSKHPQTSFTPPAEHYDYLYIDRSASLTQDSVNKIIYYLQSSSNTKLALYIKDQNDPIISKLIPHSDLIILEETIKTVKNNALDSFNQSKIVYLSENTISCQNITEPIFPKRIETTTRLSTYLIAGATILASFIEGKTIEESLRLARINLEHSKLNSTLTPTQLQDYLTKLPTTNNIELIAESLLISPKGILAADESGGSIHKKFEQLNIPDTYKNRRDYRNIFFTTKNLEQYVNGVILFDETARQTADNGQNFVEYLTSKRIIPGIKVDQGLTPLNPNSMETITKGLDGLDQRLSAYYEMGLRFAKWRAAFEIRLNNKGDFLTPSDEAISQNCYILTEYAIECQKAGIVPIVEPEIVYNGYYSIDQSAKMTGKILDKLFEELTHAGVNLRACILKVNMVIAGKNFKNPSSPEEVGEKTAEVLKNHVPEDLAGVVFLSGGQTPEQATDNLAAITKQGPYPWPVTFSFARALQDPALYAWAGDNHNAEKARQAFADRLIANQAALKQ